MLVDAEALSSNLLCCRRRYCEAAVGGPQKAVGRHPVDRVATPVVGFNFLGLLGLLGLPGLSALLFWASGLLGLIRAFQG